MTDYVLATIRQWNLVRFAKRRSSLPGSWHLFVDPADLTVKRVKTIKPRYLFFPHWSWKVPEEIYSQTETILFHMTDLPYGRGGSPLQNLIQRGHSETVISAVRMEEELDSGDIYLKRKLDLSGSAEQIFERASGIIFDMIEEIIKIEPVPVPQQGKAEFFPRRNPEMSMLPEDGELDIIYDHIRMLDAPGYPSAFIDYGMFRVSLTEATRKPDGSVEAAANITLRKGEGGHE